MRRSMRLLPQEGFLLPEAAHSLVLAIVYRLHNGLLDRRWLAVVNTGQNKHHLTDKGLG